MSDEGGSDRELWQPDDVLLTTVGIDIGSTTSHLMFARLRMQRLTSFSSRFVPVERRVLHRSPVRMTPYRGDGTIDAEALSSFVDAEYAAAGLAHDDVDTGAVILTGIALESRNAAGIAGAFANHGGTFVCATAGHRLEAILAAHGSGAVARSRRDATCVLNVDVGGGTTKLALVERGEVVATSAIAAGARLISFGAHGMPTRVEPAARMYAGRAGVRIRGNVPLPAHHRLQIASCMAAAIAEATHGRELAPALARAQLLEPIPHSPKPDLLTLSGGVAELVYGDQDADFGDLGRELAACIRDEDLPAPLERPDEAIRATVIGASQYSVQLSGSTVLIADERRLPLRNVPVAVARTTDGMGADEVARAVRQAVERAGPGASRPLVALPFRGEPRYERLRALADGLHAGLPEGPIVAAVTGDVARSVGAILVEELGRPDVLVLDGLELDELDYVDIGAVVRPAGVVPVVVKTLLF